MAAVVCDSSPLISLAHLGHFGLLKEFYSAVLIPPAVQAEVLDRGAKVIGVTELNEAIAAGWIMVRRAIPHQPLPPAIAFLDEGERQALELAVAEQSPLVIIDEIRGRTIAQKLGLKITGTIGVLVEAKNKGRVPSLRSELDLLRFRTSFYLSQALYHAALKAAGEN